MEFLELNWITWIDSHDFFSYFKMKLKMKCEEVQGDAKCANIYNFKGNVIELSHLLPSFFKSYC